MVYQTSLFKFSLHIYRITVRNDITDLKELAVFASFFFFFYITIAHLLNCSVFFNSYISGTCLNGLKCTKLVTSYLINSIKLNIIKYILNMFMYNLRVFLLVMYMTRYNILCTIMYVHMDFCVISSPINFRWAPKANCTTGCRTEYTYTEIRRLDTDVCGTSETHIMTISI